VGEWGWGAAATVTRYEMWAGGLQLSLCCAATAAAIVTAPAAAIFATPATTIVAADATIVAAGAVAVAATHIHILLAGHLIHVHLPCAFLCVVPHCKIKA